MKDPTFTELASGAGTKVTKEQLISKIIAFRSDIFRLRTQWLKKMNDDTASTESKLKILEGYNNYVEKMEKKFENA